MSPRFTESEIREACRLSLTVGWNDCGVRYVQGMYRVSDGRIIVNALTADGVVAEYKAQKRRQRTRKRHAARKGRYMDPRGAFGHIREEDRTRHERCRVRAHTRRLKRG